MKTVKVDLLLDQVNINNPSPVFNPVQSSAVSTEYTRQWEKETDATSSGRVNFSPKEFMLSSVVYGHTNIHYVVCFVLEMRSSIVTAYTGLTSIEM